MHYSMFVADLNNKASMWLNNLKHLLQPRLNLHVVVIDSDKHSIVYIASQ